MKRLLMSVLLLACPASIWAAPEAVSSRVLGDWAVDVAQLPIPPAAWPQRVGFSFEALDADRWQIQVEIVQADGQRRLSRATVPLDGSTVAIEGDQLEADVIALRQPSPDVLVMALGKQGHAASTRVYAVAADGGHMTETAVHFDADGRAVMRTFVLTRVPAR